jgi:hypothetical protein
MRSSKDGPICLDRETDGLWFTWDRVLLETVLDFVTHIHINDWYQTIFRSGLAQH